MRSKREERMRAAASFGGEGGFFSLSRVDGAFALMNPFSFS